MNRLKFLSVVFAGIFLINGVFAKVRDKMHFSGSTNFEGNSGIFYNGFFSWLISLLIVFVLILIIILLIRKINGGSRKVIKGKRR